MLTVRDLVLAVIPVFQVNVLPDCVIVPSPVLPAYVTFPGNVMFTFGLYAVLFLLFIVALTVNVSPLYGVLVDLLNAIL